MGWFTRRAQQNIPLVPGRSRTGVPVRTRPVYSYYAARPIAGRDSRSASQLRNSSVTNQAPRNHRRFVSTYTVVALICTIVVFVCVLKLLAVSPDSKIVVSAPSNYPVSQLTTTAYAEAANTLLHSSILNRSKLTLNTNGIAHTLQERFPELTSVEVTVPLVGNRPVIYVAPSEPAFTLETSSGVYAMDAKGYILNHLPAPLPGLALLKEASSRQPRPGVQYLASSTVSFCTTVLYELKQGNVPVAYLSLPASAPYELDAYVSAKPYYIRFNLESDAMQQSGAAVATIQQLGANTPAQYLDVRVLERAYYR